MARAARPEERWFWYAARTSRSVALDSDAYPSTLLNGRPLPHPAWICQGPNGGLHVDNRVGRIDAAVEKPPVPRMEINWIYPYGVRVLAKSWLAEVADLIDGSRTYVGDLCRNGQKLERWSTLHEQGAPPLMSADGRLMTCAICGDRSMTLWGRLYFSDPSVVGRPLIANGSGVFIREDLALGRALRKPAGAFKPTVVRFRPGT